MNQSLPSMTLPTGPTGGSLTLDVRRLTRISRRQVRVMAEAMARTWALHRGEARRIAVDFMAGDRLPAPFRRAPTTRALFDVAFDVIIVAVDRIRSTSLPMDVELILTGAHEMTHVVQKARGEALVHSFSSRKGRGYVAGYLEHTLEREARWYAAEVLKGMVPEVSGHFVPNEGDWVDIIPASSRFAAPAPVPIIRYRDEPVRSFLARLAPGTHV